MCVCVSVYLYIDKSLKISKVTKHLIFLYSYKIRLFVTIAIIIIIISYGSFFFSSSYHMIYIYECMSLCVSWTVESEKRYSKDKKDKRKNDRFILMYVVKKNPKRTLHF